MMQITARVLYPILKSLEQGLYVWVDPIEESLLELAKLRCIVRAPAGLDWHKGPDLHTTVLMHKGPLPKHPVMPIDRPLAGIVKAVAYFGSGDHLVGLLDSPQLHQLNVEYRSQGFVETFVEYKPHITLGKLESTVTSFERRMLLEELNLILARYPMRINYRPEQYSDIVG
jgi:hypothetical protein